MGEANFYYFTCLNLNITVKMSSSDVSDLEAEKKKMTDETKKKKNLSDSDSEDSEAEKKKKKKMEAKKKEKKKRKAEESDASDSEAENKKKKKKKKETEDGVELDEEGRVDLGRDKLMDVREFKGRVLIDIREFYTDRSSGEKKPGKKGICLNPTEWQSLKQAVNYIDKKIKKMS